MTLEHVAIWTHQLETLKDFYSKFFQGSPHEKYVNHTTCLESYFLSFESGARLELMQKPGIPANLNDHAQQYESIIHLAFSVATMKAVDEKAEELLRQATQFSEGHAKLQTDTMNLKPWTPIIIDLK